MAGQSKKPPRRAEVERNVIGEPGSSGLLAEAGGPGPFYGDAVVGLTPRQLPASIITAPAGERGNVDSTCDQAFGQLGHKLAGGWVVGVEELVEDDYSHTATGERIGAAAVPPSLHDVGLVCRLQPGLEGSGYVHTAATRRSGLTP